MMLHIRAVYRGSDSTYGSPRVYRELREQGVVCGRHRIARLMRAAGMAAVPPRRFVVTTDSAHRLPIAANLLSGQFDVAELDRVWATDITYIATGSGWLYLAVVIDLCSRLIVGWATGCRVDAKLVLTALRRALGRRGKAQLPGLLHHSDRGSQYASAEYQQLVRECGMRASMSRKGNCYDNAPVESFFATLKKEFVQRRTFASRETAAREIGDWIELFYNSQRRHSALNYLSPLQHELTHSSRRSCQNSA